ncbi:phosphoglycerate dehydrogenase [Sphingobacterium sp. CZ-UAM]|uniref:2-hydroxyacid dehydrogenase n=1 Tax=Sphingobacterium sp. CZ-UAM TaxID=1933868 RepID=UPI0009874526|nr:hydroxyacid dehydrogenase [Sphingobacterium sp. CZ-UAM]OOG19688.1 phosphoglycerate dehydrogenase [Sphingobacterium sp. CZ-UAM]
MKKTVLLLETIADEALALLTDQVDILTRYPSEHIEEITKYQHVRAIITRGKERVDQSLIHACPNLEVIARCGVGLDNIDVAAATSRGIKVVNTPGANASTVAEHTLALMLMSIRDLYQAVRQVKEGNWNWRNSYAGDELAGKTLGIIGMGNIGKRVAILAEAFSMRVLYWSRNEQEVPYSYLPLEKLLKQCDLISLHVPFPAGSTALIGTAQFALMKPGTYLINTARGGLVDHRALLEALEGQRLGGFAADVLPELPPTLGKALLANPKVLVTPHAGSLTKTTYRQMCLLAVNDVLAILHGDEYNIQHIFNYQELTASRD